MAVIGDGHLARRDASGDFSLASLVDPGRTPRPPDPGAVAALERQLEALQAWSAEPPASEQIEADLRALGYVRWAAAARAAAASAASRITQPTSLARMSTCWVS